MSPDNRARGLKIALISIGGLCFLIYPLAIIWPSGWVWHSGGGMHYFQMICGIYGVLGWFLIRAAKAPQDNRSLIGFTIWSSLVHATIMLLQVGGDHTEVGHLVGDIPALVMVAAIFWYLTPLNNEDSGSDASM